MSALEEHRRDGVEICVRARGGSAFQLGGGSGQTGEDLGGLTRRVGAEQACPAELRQPRATGSEHDAPRADRPVDHAVESQEVGGIAQRLGEGEDRTRRERAGRLQDLVERLAFDVVEPRAEPAVRQSFDPAVTADAGMDEGRQPPEGLAHARADGRVVAQLGAQNLEAMCFPARVLSSPHLEERTAHDLAHRADRMRVEFGHSAVTPVAQCR